MLTVTAFLLPLQMGWLTFPARADKEFDYHLSYYWTYECGITKERIVFGKTEMEEDNAHQSEAA